MNKYQFNTTKDFAQRLEKYLKNNSLIKKKVRITLKLLQANPFTSNLHTHKVRTRNYGSRYSSRVTGDLRIIWDFIDENTIILLITI